MEERSLRIYQEKTFFSKISNTITKILTPTKIGINGMLISIKRNNALKAYETYKAKIFKLAFEIASKCTLRPTFVNQSE